MQPPIYETIRLENLLLDIENPRHDPLDDQDAAITQMIVDQGDKLMHLADDIIMNGINPSDLIIVMPEDGLNGEFTVLEGNRRVAALKLLAKPHAAANADNSKLTKYFEDRTKKFLENPINELTCLVVENRSQALHWIELKHTGERGGAGTVSWDADAIARFNQQLGRPSPALQIINFVKQNVSLDDNTRKNLENPRISTLSRLINDPYVRNRLGINKVRGEISTSLPKDEVLKGLTKIVTDVANGTISVNDVYYKDQRQEYIDKFSDTDIPSTASPSVEDWLLFTVSDQDEKAKPARRIRNIQSPRDRKYLIPSSCALTIKHSRLAKIYRELRGLLVNDYPNACAIMFRVFLELSLEEYAELHNIELMPEMKLSVKLQRIANYIKDQGLMTADELKPVNVGYSNPNSILGIDTLHAYVHNKNIHPTAGDLKDTWDNFEKLFKVMWSTPASEIGG